MGTAPLRFSVNLTAIRTTRTTREYPRPELQMPNWDVHFAFQRLRDALINQPELNKSNEDTTRMRSIDVMLFDVLGWDRNVVETEKYCREAGYADYACFQRQSICLVLEAKKSGVTFLLPDRKYSSKPVGFALLAKECPEVEAALTQACMYALTQGARYVALSNGFQWLLALTFVSNQPLQERSVYVFESFAAIEDRFDCFFHCFSPIAISTNLPNAALLENRKAPAPAKLSTTIINYPAPTDRNVLSNELSYVIDIVWDGLEKNEKSAEFLRQCYVRPERLEDGIALAVELLKQRRSQDEGIAYRGFESDAITDILTSYESERPLVILGRIGRGKSTFLNHLRLVEAKSTLEKYIQIDIDFLHRPEKAEQVADFMFDQIEERLLSSYSIDITADNIVRGALHTELDRFSRTSDAVAYSPDSPEYKAAELAHIRKLRSDRHRFLTYVFAHFTHGRDQSVAIFVDNLDRRNDAIQEEAFLRASAMARDWCALIFVCLRPSTFHKSLKHGVLDSVAPKVITINAPKSSEVLRRRFVFAAKLANVDGSSELTGAHLTFSSEVALQLPSLAVFLNCCEESFTENRRLCKLFEAVSNGNIRDLLNYVKEALTSKHLDTRKILRERNASGRYIIAVHEMLRSLLYGDFQHYDPNRSRIVNLFDVERADPAEHFTRLLALNFIGRFRSVPATRGYVEIIRVVEYLCQIGFTSEHARSTLQFLHQQKCCEGRLPDIAWGENESDIRITSLGRYHIGELAGNFAYVDAVVVDTPILDTTARNAIRDEFGIEERVRRGKVFVEYLNSCSESIPDADAAAVWKTVSTALSHDIKRVESDLKGRRRH